MKLTKEEAIRIHRDMWQYLKEHEAGKGVSERYDLKEQYCKEQGYSFMHNCALCEYAECRGGCEDCPAIWGSEGEQVDVFCEGYEKDVEESYIDWRYSDLDDIINIKMKNYICKSVAKIRKSHPDFLEHKEFTGKKKLTIFIDPGILTEIGLPDDVVQKVLEEANNEEKGVKRTDSILFAKAVVSKNGLQYWVDIGCKPYNVRNYETDKILYSVLRVVELRFAAYKANGYGIYEGLPVDSEEIDWNKDILFYRIEDLYYYKEERENEMD